MGKVFESGRKALISTIASMIKVNGGALGELVLDNLTQSPQEGKQILQALVSKPLTTLKHLNLSDNAQWFAEDSENFDLLLQFINSQKNLKQITISGNGLSISQISQILEARTTLTKFSLIDLGFEDSMLE